MSEKIISDEEIENEIAKIRAAYPELTDTDVSEIQREFKRMQRERSVSDIAAARWCMKALLARKYRCSKGHHTFEWRQTRYDGQTGEPKEVFQCRYCGAQIIK